MLAQSREKEVVIHEAEVQSKMKVDEVMIKKSKVETKKLIAEANLIQVQACQTSEKRVFKLWKQLMRSELLSQ